MDKKTLVPIIIIVAIFALVVLIKFSGFSINGAVYQEQKYGFASWNCPDGTHKEMSGCKTNFEWMDYAQNFCNSHCHQVSANVRQCNTMDFRVSGNCPKVAGFRGINYAR